MRCPAVLTLTLLLSSAACAQRPHDTVGTRPVAPDTALVRAIAEQLRETARLPGLGIAAMRDDRIVYAAGFGVRDLQRGTPVDTATQFGAASVSKVIAATAALRLYQRGAFDLDLPVRRAFPDFPDPSDGITPRRLAAHLSGLPHYDSPESMPPDGRFERARDALAVFARAPRAGAPGERYHYSTHGFTLLSAMMEAAEAKPILDILDTEVLRPLDMPGTGPMRKDRPTAAMTSIYDRTNGHPGPVENPLDFSYSWAGAGLRSTPADLVRMTRGYFNGFLHDSVVQLAFAEQQAADGTPTGVGFVWRVGTDWRGRPIAHHAGVNSGARSVVMMFREERSAIAVQTNITWRSSIESTAMVFAEALFASAPRREPVTVAGTWRGTFAGSPATGTWHIVGDTGSISTPDALGRLFDADGMRVDRLPVRAIRDGLYALITPWGVYPLRLAYHADGPRGHVALASREWVMEADGLLTCAPTAETFVDYYASIAVRESPFEDFAGTHRLTAEEAGRRNHWRFAYGADRRLSSVTFALGTSPRVPNHTANYFSEAPVIEICYRGDSLEVRHFRDAHGNPILVRGNVAEERYRLDSLGYRSSLTFHDADGAAVENGWGIARYAWTIGKDGHVIEERVNAAGAPAAIRPGFPFHRVRLRFGPNGWLALMDNIDADGRLVQNPLNAAQDRLEYRADGHAHAWNVYDAREERAEGNGPRVARGLMSYDDDGLESGEQYENRTGAPMTNAYGFTMTRSAFDRFGNMLSRVNHDRDGRPLNNPRTGYAGYFLTWDSTGRLQRRLEYRDADGRPAIHRERGHHAVVERHDAAGNVAEMRYEDADGRLVNRLDNGVAMIRLAYDARRRVTERRFLDADGRPVVVNGSAIVTYEYRPDGYRR